MLKIEKTVFISYRRTNSFMALAVYQALSHQGYDCFLDYQNIDSGAFDQIILNQVKARAHFILILTPSALERCSEPGDWLRREIETAIDHKRNIVPLMFEGFDYGDPSIAKHLTGKLSVLSTYNALRVPADFFEEAIARLMSRFLNIPIDMVIHPTPPAEKVEVAKRQQAASAAPTVTEAELTAEEYFEQCSQFYNNGEYDRVIEALTQAIRLKPDYARAFSARGACYKAIGQNAEADKDFDQVIRFLTPTNFEDFYARGNAYRGKGDVDAAIADYDQAIRLKPDYADAYLNRGGAYFKKGDYARAIQDYEQALRINPNYENARKNLEIAKGKLGR